MANPQKEEGYTPIANELLEAIIKTSLTACDIKVLLLVMRKTYGWNKKEDKISLTQFQQATGFSRQSICKSIKTLVKRSLLGSKRSFTTEVVTYWLAKDYHKWDTSQLAFTSKAQLTRASQIPYKQLVNQGLPTKDNITKDNIKKRLDNEKFTHLTNKVFSKTFDSYLYMRKTKKKEATFHAQELVLKKLHQFSLETAIKMLENSICNSWTDVYPLKTEIKQEKSHAETMRERLENGQKENT